MVVLDVTGTAVPLATQAAADIVKTGDPIWCPSGATPGSSGCTAPAAGVTDNLADLVTYLESNQPSHNGTIWIEQSTSSSPDTSSSPISIDGSSLTTWANYTLTLQGGWDGTSSTTLVGTSYFTEPISITNWNADITFKDIAISGTAGDGLTVQTTGNITVQNVKSNHNSGNGAYLNNDSIVPTAAATINISDSDFSNNGTAGVSYDDGFGVKAISNGSITLTDVTADDNYDDGAYLDNCLDNSSGSCTNLSSNIVISVDNSGISGGDGFNSNGKGNTGISADGYGGNGLEAYSTGSVTLTNVTADGNLYDGALLGYYNSDGPTYDEIGGNITITGGDFSDNNIDYSETDNPAGLEAYADGSIQVSGTTADDNWDDGAYLENYFGSGDINIDYNGSIANGNSDFSGNDTNGLEAYSAGAITLYNVTADSNFNADGAYLENDFGSSTGGITVEASIFGKSSTTGNGTDGLDAYSNGEVSLSGVTADYNAYGGADLGSELGIAVDPSSFNNNESFGLGAISYGAITLNDVTVDANNYVGAFLVSYSGVVNGVNVVNSHFDGNGGDGLDIFTIGDAIVNCGSTANNNSGYGVSGYINGTFTNGLTLVGNGAGANGVLSGTEVDTPCGGGGKGTAPIVGDAGSLPWNVVNVPDSWRSGQYVGLHAICRYRTRPAQWRSCPSALPDRIHPRH